MSDKRYWDEALETMPRDALEAKQLSDLKEHLAFAYENSPYYKRAFDEAGVSATINALTDLRAFPFINKHIVREQQEAKPDLGNLLSVPEDDVVFVAASSGSTGVPTLSPFTSQDFEEFQDVQARLWAGTVPSDRLMFILKQFKPTVTWTTPSYAWHLGETAKKQGIDPAKDLAINKIIVAGEPGGSIPATRQAIEDLWDAQVYDFYGLSDIFGANAGACEARDGLHLAEDHTILEVLDENLQPVADGEKGEMVLTTLRKKARPMIRFRTGDIISRNRERCTCGRTHARITIHGRVDDMFIISGVNVFPSDIEFVVRSMDDLNGEYRVVVYKEGPLTRFDIEVEKETGSSMSNTALANEIQEQIKQRSGVRPKQIHVLEDGELPRTTHKAKRLLDKRPSA